MAYTADKPKLVPPSDVLRQRILGWGVDLDPKNRPAVPKERFDPAGTGARWTFPERQLIVAPREKSTEHRFVTPVFGTAVPLKGVSGAIRRQAYRLSEGRSAHWLLLMLADRVDVFESGLRALVQGHPDNLLAERGLSAEVRYGGIRSRVGQHRADLAHPAVEVLAAVGVGLAAVGVAYGLTRMLAKPQRA